MPSLSSRLSRAVPALLLSALLVPAVARANATFEFTVVGQFDWQTCANVVCDVLQENFAPWTGRATIVLDSGADGVYDKSDLVSFDMATTGVTFHEPSFTAIPFDATLTVQGGKMTSVFGHYYDPVIPDIVTRFLGMTLDYYSPALYFSPVTQGTAVLTAVPEPGAWAMQWLGLAMAGVGVLRARRR